MKSLHLIVLGAALMLPGLACAQTAASAIPDLKGTWVGKSESLVDGPAAHHPLAAPGTPAGAFRLREESFSLSIEGQQGKRVWGSSSSQYRKSERLLGTLMPDGKTIYFVTQDGFIDAVLTDSDTMDICYRHVEPASAVVALNHMVRQK